MEYSPLEFFSPHWWSRSSCDGILQTPSITALVGYAVEFHSLFSGRRSCVQDPSTATLLPLTISDTNLSLSSVLQKKITH